MPVSVSGGSNSGGNISGHTQVAVGQVTARGLETWETLGVLTGNLTGRGLETWETLAVATGPLAGRGLETWETLVQPPTPPQGTDIYNVIMADNPIGYYRMDAVAGDTEQLDASGHGLNAYVSGTVTFGETSLMLYQDTDTAAYFNGGHLDLPFNMGSAPGFTIVFWYQEKGRSGSPCYIADSNVASDGSNKGFELYNNNGNWAAAVGNGTTTASNTNITPIAENTSGNHMAVLGWDGNDVYFILDNVGEWQAALSGGTLGSYNNVAVGYNPVTANSPIDSVMDELAIFDHWIGTERVAAYWDASLGQWNSSNNNGQLYGSTSGGTNAVGMNGQRPSYIEVIYV